MEAAGPESWRRLCSETFVPLETVADTDFVGRIEHVQMGGVTISRVTCGPCVVGRSRRAIRSAPRSDVLFNVVDRGSTLLSTSRTASVLDAGHAALCAADTEYGLGMQAPAVVLTLQLDRSLLPIADDRIHAAHADPLRSTARVAVLRHFMHGVLAGSALGEDHSMPYGLIARDLLLLALNEHDEASDVVANEDSAFVMVRTHLERHFTDADLTIDQMTRRLKVSRRYVEGLFARQGLSPAAYLRSLRLARAQVILAGSSSASVAEAARLSGFSDSATFSRAFRRATGLTPTAWRRDHQLRPE